MKAVWYGPGDLAWFEPETDAESRILETAKLESWSVQRIQEEVAKAMKMPALVLEEAKPSIVIFIDSEKQETSFIFRPQNLSPEQYGVVLSSAILHIAKLFREKNPEKSESQIIEMIEAGIAAGLTQREDEMPPTKPH